ncbi:MAG: hypothetical protein Kow0068_16510 [Marinilabiliales bacterium]
MKLFFFLIVYFIVLINTYSQKYISFNSGALYYIINDIDEGHEYYNYDVKPTLFFSVNYLDKRDNNASGMAVSYKRFMHDRIVRTGGLGCPSCYQEDINSKTDMLELGAFFKYYFVKNSPFFIKIGLQYSQRFYSKEKGLKTVSYWEQLPDTDLYYLKTDNIWVNESSSYKNEASVVFGLGADIDYYEKCNLCFGFDLKPLLGYKPLGIIDIYFGIAYKLGKNNCNNLSD